MIHVAGFCGKEFGFLQSDGVVLIEAVFCYCRVPKRRQLELRRRGITQKGIIYILMCSTAHFEVTIILS